MRYEKWILLSDNGDTMYIKEPQLAIFMNTWNFNFNIKMRVTYRVFPGDRNLITYPDEERKL